ncbi:chaperone protein TorD [Oceanisphaera avium]|uniref:Chaperone protein TorD n=1 Tax=Oceanisphaera avium TaxID=1903694 RepID=A0A1Y0CX16_9GAMM|nr:chaperone protein TorD [Oceanisphaera avium]ART79881.1 chaperone protein TorD [Oceanisphaera avium]
MQDFIVTSQRRAELYHWFTALLSLPLTAQDLDEFGSYDMHDFLNSLATLDPLHDATQAFRAKTEHVLALQAPQATLNQQYQQLFEQHSLLDSSAFGEPSQASLLLMSVLLKQHGTQLSDDDPLHICNQLEMMASLALAATEADSEAVRLELLDQQRELANDLLLNNLPQLAKACATHDSFGFYASATQLLLAFFSMDIHYLNNVAP